MVDHARAAEFYRSQSALKLSDPIRFQRFNVAQRRLLRALVNPKPEQLTLVLFLKPNRVGGSHVTIAALSAIMMGTDRPEFQISPFGDHWPYGDRAARLVSTSETLGDVGPIQQAIKTLFPRGRYSQSRGVGKSYFSAMKTDEGKPGRGWRMDMLSYGQDALAAAGANMKLVVMSEPPPRDMFTECLTRLSGSGLLILECTQLDLAGWLEEIAEDAGGRVVDGIQYGALKLDGRQVGEVRIVRGDVEDACREHSGGHMSHSAIEALIAGWPAEEREARRTGKPLRLSGRIYPTWGEAHELGALEPYHQKCWDNSRVRIASVIDPADERPWACTWFAVFPNSDVIAFAEWPTFDYAACKSSPVKDVEGYRGLIAETEADIGARSDLRWIDGLFGAATKSGSGTNLMDMLSKPCPGCLTRFDRNEVFERCTHRLIYHPAPAYDGSVRDGHILVRAALGDHAAGVRPRLYAMRDACPNFCFGMRRYAWKLKKDPERAMHEQPSLIFKDFPDTVRMLYLAKGNVWPVDREGLDDTKPMYQGSVTRARALKKPGKPR